MSLIEWSPQWHVGVAQMDATHEEFVALINALDEAQGSTFVALYARLLAHTREHFAHEEALMLKSGFPAIVEHTSEHRRVLGEMERFGSRVREGKLQLARAYVQDAIPQWFSLHRSTMDMATAVHLRATLGN